MEPHFPTQKCEKEQLGRERERDGWWTCGWGKAASKVVCGWMGGL